MGLKTSVKDTMREFRLFALQANALDLAIGVAVGGAFTAVVQAIVSGFFTPLIAAIFGATNFANLYFTINGSHILYGLFINAIVTLIIVSGVLFFFVVKPLSAIRRRLGYETPAPALSPCPACLTPINEAALRCSSCTEQLGEGWASTS